jgi:hypothetical protein
VKTYKTKSGTYTEEELAVVVWTNPKSKTSKHSRTLETMTAETSRFPMAFPLSALRGHRSWQKAVVVTNSSEVYSLLKATSRTSPLIIPLTIARSALGWDNFYVPTEYTQL